MDTCRFCRQWDNQHTIVRYSIRHSAHLKCLKEKGKLEKLHGLSLWQLNQLPVMELRRLGLLETVKGICEEKLKEAK